VMRQWLVHRWRCRCDYSTLPSSVATPVRCRRVVQGFEGVLGDVALGRARVLQFERVGAVGELVVVHLLRLHLRRVPTRCGRTPGTVGRTGHGVDSGLELHLLLPPRVSIDRTDGGDDTPNADDRCLEVLPHLPREPSFTHACIVYAFICVLHSSHARALSRIAVVCMLAPRCFSWASLKPSSCSSRV
jgi:hypothetical protein